MSFITESYSINQRRSGKWGLLGKSGWYMVQNAEGKWGVKVFAERKDAIAFWSAKCAEEMEQRKEKRAEKEAVQKIVEDFKRREEIKQLIEDFCHDNGDGTCTVKRSLKTASGKTGFIEWNNGFTQRSWKCVALYIGGVCMFTSGTIDKVIEYIATR